MRALPDGIRVERAGGTDVSRVRALVEAGLLTYREWAPGFELVEAPPERVAQLRALYEGDEAWVLMALERDEVVGVISLSPRTAADPDPAPPGTIYLWQMFVSPPWQGSGLAQALLDLALREAKQRGVARMTLWAAAGAKQARRFYEKEGFTPTGRTQHDDAFGMDLVQYGVELG
jgi:GNAT superfamily N-acetyltransferase